MDALSPDVRVCALSPSNWLSLIVVKFVLSYVSLLYSGYFQDNISLGCNTMNTLREPREQSHLCAHIRACMHVCVCVEFERDGSLDKEKGCVDMLLV